jgi:DHA3 family macrolide efflux protein-like MFS transporter
MLWHMPSAIMMLSTLMPYAIILSLNALYPKIFLALPNGTVWYALLVIPYGMGAMIGSAFHWAALDALHFKSQILIYMSLFTLALLGFSVSQSVCLIYMFMFIFAFCHATIRVKRQTRLMIDTHLGQIGNISSRYERVAIVTTIVLALVNGYLADAYGLWITMGFMITLMLICILVIFFLD